MRRREFIALVGGAAAWPLAARAQQPAKVWRIGYLIGAAAPPTLDKGLLQGMHELGYVEGRDFVIEWRFAESKYDRIPELAAELVRLNVDVIVAGSPAIRATQQATSTIPIVMANASDPVGLGYVASLARPGGNITGVATSGEDTAPKQLELLATAVPHLSRVGLLGNPDQMSPILNPLQHAADNAGLTVVLVRARNPQEIENAFATMTAKNVGAVVVIPNVLFWDQRQQIAELAIKRRLPSISWQEEFAVAGGLMSYGQSEMDFHRRAAYYVDKIFKGAKPADLPVEQPTKFELVINLKTATALGLTVPPSLLARADKVIE